jgi:hypothetical protein
LPVANVIKYHALKFREAVQAIPRSRSGELAKARLPHLVAWRKYEAKGLSPETVNKPLEGVQAIVKSASQAKE